MSREISTGWWNDVCRSIFGFQEHAPLGFEDALVAVAVLEMERPEWGFLKRERRFSFPNTGVTAVLAEFGFLGLRNNINSGVLCVLDMFVNNSVGQEMDCRIGLRSATFDPAVAAEVSVNAGLDTREYTAGAAPVSAIQVIRGTATAVEIAGLGAPHGSWHAPNVVHSAAINAPVSRLYRPVLAPGSDIIFASTVVNSTIAGHFYFRERPLHKGVRA